MIYIIVLNLKNKIKILITYLLYNKIIILINYWDFTNIFLFKFITKFLKYKINIYIIKLKKNNYFIN